MKKIIFMISCLILVFSVVGCGVKTTDSGIPVADGAEMNMPTDNNDKADIDKEQVESITYEENEINRTIIAEALGVEENNTNIRFILSSLDVINAGQIQSAKLTEIDGEKVINVVAEDDQDYRIYLSRSGSVVAVENLTTGEWPIRSER